jgi:hypothetical protein
METKSKLKKLEDLSGKKFNRLTALSVDLPRTQNDKYWRVFWICKCICGTIKSVSSASLKSNHTKSCGCWKLENSKDVCRKNFTKETVVPPRRNIFTQYVAKCKTKGMDFLIPESQFYKLIESACHYCGSGPQNTKTVKLSPTKTKTYSYNGVDRVDNFKGYVVGNVVSCCNNCNKAKRDLSLTNFYNWVKMIYRNLKTTHQI